MAAPRRRRKRVRTKVSRVRRSTRAKVRKRPAELTGVSGAVASIIGYGLGLRDPAILFAISVVVGFAPAGITWFVNLIRSRD